MASSNSTLHSPTYGPDPTTPNTTFVQADPSNFRAVVQKLTGASDDPSAPKLPLTLPSRRPELVAQKKPNFKLHERRNAAAKNLHLTIAAATADRGVMLMMPSPVSPLEILARGSPRTPREEEEKEEKKAIAEKGFYLHPSPRLLVHLSLNLLNCYHSSLCILPLITPILNLPSTLVLLIIFVGISFHFLFLILLLLSIN